MANDSEHKAHMKIIDRCIKRRQSRRPADVVDRIRVDDVAWADAVQSRVMAAGYDPRPRPVSAPARPPCLRDVRLSISDHWTVLAEELAVAQGISPEKFMASILTEGMLEAWLEVSAQRNALERAGTERKKEEQKTFDLDDNIPF